MYSIGLSWTTQFLESKFGIVGCLLATENRYAMLARFCGGPQI